MIIEPESDSEVIARNEQIVPEKDDDTLNKKMVSSYLLSYLIL